MPRLQATLESEMLAVVPEIDPVTSSLNVAQAYGNYMKAATSNGVPAVALFIDATCVPAMAAAMVFTEGDTPAQGAAKFVAGYLGFWSAAVAAPAAFIVGATVIVPPTFAALAAALAARFPIHVGPPSATLAQAMANLATDVHTATSLTPTAQFGVPVFPIL